MEANSKTTKSKATNSSTTKKPVRRKRRMPHKDSVFAALCHTVSKEWKENPFFVLLNITQPQFEQMALDFSAELLAVEKLAGNRPVLTGKLAHADKQINRAVGQIKIYLKEKYEIAAASHYPVFGIEQYGKQYDLPKDRSKRTASLKMIKSAIVKKGFSNKKYGKQFWADMYQQYGELYQAAYSNDGERSKRVANKKLLRRKLTDALNSLILLIRANYGKYYRGRLRKWGFQKEKY